MTSHWTFHTLSRPSARGHDNFLFKLSHYQGARRQCELRCYRWDIFKKEPPSENGKTQLRPLVADLVASLNTLIANKEFKAALDKEEVAFTAGANHLWLGLQRVAAQACQGLGEPYKQ